MSDRDYKILLDAEAVARKNNLTDLAEELKVTIEEIDSEQAAIDGQRDMASAMRAPF